MRTVNIGDLIATSIIVMLIALFFISLFLFVKNIAKRNTTQQKNDQYVAQSLENIQKQNEEIIDLLKKMIYCKTINRVDILSINLSVRCFYGESINVCF